MWLFSLLNITDILWQNFQFIIIIIININISIITVVTMIFSSLWVFSLWISIKLVPFEKIETFGLPQRIWSPFLLQLAASKGIGGLEGSMWIHENVANKISQVQNQILGQNQTIANTRNHENMCIVYNYIYIIHVLYKNRTVFRRFSACVYGSKLATRPMFWEPQFMAMLTAVKWWETPSAVP